MGAFNMKFIEIEKEKYVEEAKNGSNFFVEEMGHEFKKGQILTQLYKGKYLNKYEISFGQIYCVDDEPGNIDTTHKEFQRIYLKLINQEIR